MENATKALLIAAAVLVAILIISLTIAIVRQGSEAVSGADLSEAEQAQFNGKFTNYEGSNVTTARVNALLQAVLTHNQTEEQAGTDRFVSVEGEVTQSTNATTITRQHGSAYYTVSCEYTNGLVSTINIDEN